jgi:DNA helicase-2/ATP-dependent DNA helicase PcrA
MRALRDVFKPFVALAPGVVARVRLNKAQQEAVDHDLGPLLVLAGAGSGKTGVVTQRIARLIRSGVPASTILAMTFTNKAAGEMQERVTRLVGAKATKGLLVCTFHRFGLEVLGREVKALGFRGGRFAIYDRADCIGILRDVLRPIFTGKNHDIGAILNRISLAKNAFIDPEAFTQFAARSNHEYDEITALAYPKYTSTLAALQAFDFDDLVCEPVRLWRRREDVLKRWRMRYRYVIVDEYQDTNTAQLEMLRLLVDDHRNLCVVGDDDQAIYAWRGADVRNILDFERHFTGAKVVRLERNYRSTKAILDVANAVLEASTAPRHEKRLIPTRGEGEKVQVVTAADNDTESKYVAESIKTLVDRGTARPKEIAVLYRSNLQAGEIEIELKARGVPYQMFGGTQTFERKEVKDVLAYLAVATDPTNELAVRRSINYPPRGIGDVALDKIGNHATAYDLTLIEAVEKAHAIVGLSEPARAGCRAYARIIAELRRDMDDILPVRELVGGLLEAIELKRAIGAECGQNAKAAARRWANVNYLLKTLERRENKQRMDREAWQQFLRVLMLREESEEEEVVDKVTLTTMHGAKGLEFDHVFVIGLEEGLMPHKRSTEERSTDAPPIDGRVIDEIAQERRLFYVAVTRAKKHLYLCWARARGNRGKLVKRAPSRFLLTLPDELVDKRDMLEPPKPDANETKRGLADVLAAIAGSSE